MDTRRVYEVAAMTGDAPPCAACGTGLFTTELQTGRTVCGRCERQIADQLVQVGVLWAELPYHRLATNTHQHGGGGGGYGPVGSAAPGNLTVTDLLAGGATARLAVWETDWRHTLRLGPARRHPDHDRALAAAVGFLRSNLPWAVTAHAAGAIGLRTDLFRLVRLMTAAVGGDITHLVRLPQRCPYRPVEQADDEDAPKCGGVLLADRGERTIRCAQCRVRVPMHRWLELGITLGTVPHPAAGLGPAGAQVA